MKIVMDDGRVVILGVHFGHEQPQSPLPERANGHFRSVKMTVSVFSPNGVSLGSVSGISYCNPTDQFVRATGRMLAMRRLLANDRYRKLLSVHDRRILCPIMLTGRR